MNGTVAFHRGLRRQKDNERHCKMLRHRCKANQHLLQVIEPMYHPVCAGTLWNKYVIPMYHETQGAVIKDITDTTRYAITTDGWTSLRDDEYVTTTVHYADPTNELQSRLLGTIRLDTSHTAENFTHAMQETLLKCKLKDTGIVTDNARNIVNAWLLTACPHIGCLAHSVNLLVYLFLKLSEVSLIVGKMGASFKQSGQKTTKLQAAKNELKLDKFHVLKDVELWWNSSLQMMRHIRQVYPAIAKVLLEYRANHLLLSDSDTHKIKELVMLLQPFEGATVMISYLRKPTSGMILSMLKEMKVRMEIHEDDSTSHQIIEAGNH